MEGITSWERSSWAVSLVRTRGPVSNKVEGKDQYLRLSFDVHTVIIAHTPIHVHTIKNLFLSLISVENGLYAISES